MVVIILNPWTGFCSPWPTPWWLDRWSPPSTNITKKGKAIRRYPILLPCNTEVLHKLTTILCSEGWTCYHVGRDSEWPCEPWKFSSLQHCDQWWCAYLEVVWGLEESQDIQEALLGLFSRDHMLENTYTGSSFPLPVFRRVIHLLQQIKSLRCIHILLCLVAHVGNQH